jgi:hypothetical protein
MQKIIFFTPIVETGKLATIISIDPVVELKAQGIIPDNSLTLIKDYDESDLDLRYAIYHVDFFAFNDATNPTDIVFNKELFDIYVLDVFRQKRNEVFKILDSLQTRAMLSNKSGVIAEIEADKTVLRDTPDNIDWSDKLTVKDFYSNMPIELTIDYMAKYEAKLK